MKYDVFISYSSKDQKVVEAMCAYLEQHKVRCFVAYRDIPKGVVWAKAIVEALDESKMMVVVFSEEFNLSDQVDREIGLASEDKKPILTFRISDAVFKGVKKYYLKNINWIDAFPHPEKVFDALLDNVCKLIGIPLTSTNTNYSIPMEKPVEKTWKVGDYYNVNGKEGVVFWVDKTGKHGKIVSLDQAVERWCSDSEYYRKIGVIDVAIDESNGMKTQQSVMKINDWHNKYPAFAWCADQGDEWYLPAIEELKVLYNGYYAVNNKIVSMGGKEMISSFPWCSSTNINHKKAWFLSGGYAFEGLKVNRSYVRAVSTF